MAIDYIDTTDKNEDRSDRLTLSHDAFMAHVAQCPPEDQERMNWLWGYLHNVLNRSKSRLMWLLRGNAVMPLKMASTGLACAPLQRL